ncbi:hypothetical protein [Acidovorax sp.]|uniref:hypothetical protein n=1 Tax=Acidovorax sp. TaxID=1872122 RepID=UPI00391F0D71
MDSPTIAKQPTTGAEDEVSAIVKRRNEGRAGSLQADLWVRRDVEDYLRIVDPADRKVASTMIAANADARSEYEAALLKSENGAVLLHRARNVGLADTSPQRGQSTPDKGSANTDSRPHDAKRLNSGSVDSQDEKPVLGSGEKGPASGNLRAERSPALESSLQDETRAEPRDAEQTSQNGRERVNRIEAVPHTLGADHARAAEAAIHAKVNNSDLTRAEKQTVMDRVHDNIAKSTERERVRPAASSQDPRRATGSRRAEQENESELER